MTRLLPIALAALTASASVSAQQAGTTGQIDLLYIRGEWAQTPMPLTNGQWQTRLGNLHAFADGYWSFHGAGFITGMVETQTPRFMIPGPAPTVATPLDPWDVRADLVQLAEAAGFVLDDYDHIVLSYPSVAHTFSFGALGTPGTIWMPGPDPWGPGFVHESGHAFGVGHASHWEGGPLVLPGQHREGRDGLFMMGSDSNGIIGGSSTINMPMRYLMGHTHPENVEVALHSGVRRLHEFELAALPQGKLTAVRVPVGGDVPGDWWVSFAPKMADRWANFAGSDGFLNGVVVHQLDGAVTRSLDFRPQTLGGIGTNEEDYVDCRDGALRVGESYSFPGSEVTIRPLAIGVDNGVRWIEVDVDLGATAGPLLVHEEFDGYAAGDIDGQSGLGLGLTDGVWSQTGGTGTFRIGPGLSGPNALTLDSNGVRCEIVIDHDTPLWGIGQLWFSCLYSESSTTGHFLANGAGGFPGAVGHTWWTRTWAINNISAPGNQTFGLGETHRLVAQFDWDAGHTSLWIDPSARPVTDPLDPHFAPAAFKLEAPPSSPRQVFLSFAAGTEGTVDDIRIGTTFASTVEPGREFCLAADCPCGNSTSDGGCINSTGEGAALRASGTSSVSADDLELRVANGAPHATSILFMGGATSSVLLGDGVRCVAPGSSGLCRLPIRTMDGSGTAIWNGVVGMTAAPSVPCAVTAGSTWHFQAWFRDVGGPCGQGSNLSSARSVLFSL